MSSVIIYSDQGTNFIGSDNLWKELDWGKIQKVNGMEKIIWKFNPLAAPWWGGFWERLIRPVKDLLKRTLGSSKMSYDKLRTYIIEASAVINGRPLTTVTEDTDDLQPLTPAMFLNTTPYSCVTDTELLEASGFRKYYQAKQCVLGNFKLRFRREYLGLLVQRTKEKNIREFKVGDVVLVGADNKKRWEWPMGRILELFPGRDGHVRVARVKTAKGELTRPLQRLFAMEIENPNQLPSVLERKDKSGHDAASIHDLEELRHSLEVIPGHNAASIHDLEELKDSLEVTQVHDAPSIHDLGGVVDELEEVGLGHDAASFHDTSKEVWTRCGRKVKVPARFED